MNNYAMVKGFSPMIREVIRTDRMPPYHADPHVGKFSDDKRLTPGRDQDPGPLDRAGRAARRGRRPAGRRQARGRRNGRWASRTWCSTCRPTRSRPPAWSTTSIRAVANPLTEGRWLRASTIKVERAPGRAPHPDRLHGRGAQAGQQVVREQVGRLGRRGYAVGAESDDRADERRRLPAAGRRHRLPDPLHALRQGSDRAHQDRALLLQDKRTPEHGHAQRS